MIAAGETTVAQWPSDAGLIRVDAGGDMVSVRTLAPNPDGTVTSADGFMCSSAHVPQLIKALMGAMGDDRVRLCR